MAGIRRVVVVVSAFLAFTGSAQAAGVRVLVDPSTPAGGPFPSDRFTVRDPSHLTGLRIALPKPDCAVRVSDCQDIDVLNTLDGFNLQPRVSIPFSGAVDPGTLTSQNIFFVRLGDARHRRGEHRRIGINQVVWNPVSRTVHAESDELLDQHTRYALVVTRGVRDSAGDRIAAGDLARFRPHGPTRDAESDDRSDREALQDALDAVGVHEGAIAAISVFTTQSATTVLEKIRDQIKAKTPPPATILASVAKSKLVVLQWDRQVGITPPPASAPVFAPPSFIPPVVYDIVPGSVDALVFGKYASPDYETADKFIPAVGTATGTPAVQRSNDLYFNLVLPSGPRPPRGWPVAIFGHGFTDSKQGAPVVVASMLASHGIASIAVNVVGHGGGPDGRLTILSTKAAPVTFPDGGRGIDQNGDGQIDSTEGSSAAPPRGIIGNRDGLRQTVVDLMQLVRVIETGGIPGLDRSRIYYAGQSFGGIYGTMMVAVEPSLRAGVPNVPGGAIIEIARLSPAFRGLVALALLERLPPLSNAPPKQFAGFPFPIPSFNENIPLRNLLPVVDTVPGAEAIQEVIDNTEWVSQSGNPVAYAPHIRKSVLDGLHGTPVIIQFAKGDRTVPNPTASALIRAGALEDRATYFRNDLAVATIPGISQNPHTFLTNVFGAGGSNPGVVQALQAQNQIGIFFATDGRVTVDPDGDGPLFETPIVGPLPETLNFPAALISP